jgi:hypothetical protein
MRSLPAALGAALLLSAAGNTPAQAPPSPAPASSERFFTALVGEWVGTAEQRVNGQEPLRRFFHLVVRRRDARTFETGFRYYRPNAKTGALEEAGSEQGTSTLDPDGTVQRSMEGKGTVLVDYRPKPESHSATGRARPTAAGGLEGEASGKIDVQGLPFGLGRHGTIESAREEWSVADGALSGRTAIVARFRALFTSRRFKVESTCRAERGADVSGLAARAGTKQTRAPAPSDEGYHPLRGYPASQGRDTSR